MDLWDELFDDENTEIENMRKARKQTSEAKDFAKLINKKDLSGFEMDEIFM